MQRVYSQGETPPYSSGSVEFLLNNTDPFTRHIGRKLGWSHRGLPSTLRRFTEADVDNLFDLDGHP